MHLVFATSIVPDGAAATGYEIANAAVLGALRRAGAKVTVLGFAWPGRAPADPDDTILLDSLDVRTGAASASRKLRWLAAALSSGLPFACAKLRSVSVDEVRTALRRIGPVDGYVLNAVQFAGAFEDAFVDRPSIFVAHNVERRSAEESAAAAPSLLRRLLYRREASLLGPLEMRLCARARFVFTFSEEDRAILGAADESRSAALPLVTRAEAPSPSPSRKTDCDAALIGTWTWAPNRIGLEWFLREVTLHLSAGFTIRIAGDVPAGLSAAHPGVRFVGRVPDAAEFVRSAAVVPLVSRAGTGVQLKTIETFELGLPSVATTSALRGVGHRPDNCAVTDDPAEFAHALERAARERRPDADGRAFHRTQREALDAGVARGLRSLGFQPERALA